MTAKVVDKLVFMIEVILERYLALKSNKREPRNMEKNVKRLIKGNTHHGIKAK